MVTDKVADLIIRIKNASIVNKDSVVVPYSKLRNSILQTLRKENYLENVESLGHGKDRKLVLKLNYKKDGTRTVNDVKRISSPGKRVYLGCKDIRPVKNGFGSLILSTSKGILTDKQARKERVGGEVLFLIW